jgi:hypothetical protein
MKSFDENKILFICFYLHIDDNDNIQYIQCDSYGDVMWINLMIWLKWKTKIATFNYFRLQISTEIRDQENSSHTKNLCPKWIKRLLIIKRLT